MTTIVVCFVVNLMLVGCGSESPSGLTEKWFNAVVKKDIKTVARYLCFPDLSPKEELVQISETSEQLTAEGLWSFEIKGELISANGESAIVTAIIKTERNIKNDEDGEELKLFWVKTKNNGWKIDVEKSK